MISFIIIVLSGMSLMNRSMLMIHYFSHKIKGTLGITAWPLINKDHSSAKTSMSTHGFLLTTRKRRLGLLYL